MESFVHMRKGRTPQRLHADLDGGFTGRKANDDACTDWLHRHRFSL